MSSEAEAAIDGLELLGRLVGQQRVMLRCDTDLLETVYLEVVGGRLVIHDRGETWFEIVTATNRHRPWDDRLVAELCERHDVEVLVEHDGPDEGAVVATRLVRSLGEAERLPSVVAQFAHLLDEIFDRHSDTSGWRDTQSL